MNQRKLAMIIISVVITGLLILTVYDYKSQLRLEDEVRSKVLDRQRILQEIEQSTPLVTLRGVVSYNDTCSCVVIAREYLFQDQRTSHLSWLMKD